MKYLNIQRDVSCPVAYNGFHTKITINVSIINTETQKADLI